MIGISEVNCCDSASGLVYCLPGWDLISHSKDLRVFINQSCHCFNPFVVINLSKTLKAGFAKGFPHPLSTLKNNSAC